MFAALPEPPYVAVIFTNQRADVDDADGYEEMAARMAELAAEQPGYIGIESVREESGAGITVSYWSDEACAVAWKQVAEHLGAQRLGRERWYAGYITRVAVVSRQYEFHRDVS
jgi:heme-degrading monooxygenase HmoA